MEIMVLLLIMMVLAALWAVMTSLLLRSAIALALTSVILTVIMYRMGAPLAAVFELSVCAGLISVVFISVISLTHRLPLKEYLARRQSRIMRFWPLPVILIIAGVALILIKNPLGAISPVSAGAQDVRAVMWNLRQLDLFGQIMILLAGVFGVLILFKGYKHD
jgi:NADH-quinone oxidoreductase subunit J